MDFTTPELANIYATLLGRRTATLGLLRMPRQDLEEAIETFDQNLVSEAVTQIKSIQDLANAQRQKKPVSTTQGTVSPVGADGKVQTGSIIAIRGKQGDDVEVGKVDQDMGANMRITTSTGQKQTVKKTDASPLDIDINRLKKLAGI